MGNFASVWAKTDTGTVAVDVPTDALQYHFLWTESRPRYLADFDIEKVKEKAGGKFEIKGNYSDRRCTTATPSQEVIRRRRRTPGDDPPTTVEHPRAVSLDLTTARSIILLNVSPNEVMSDLHERPLTNAAKADGPERRQPADGGDPEGVAKIFRRLCPRPCRRSRREPTIRDKQRSRLDVP